MFLEINVTEPEINMIELVEKSKITFTHALHLLFIVLLKKN